MFALLHPANGQADWPLYAGASLFGYLLGSIPFGLIFSLLFGAGDVRKIGSGNIGATNVLRTGNKTAAALTLVFDAAKGAAVVLVLRNLYGDELAVVGALGAFLGHLFPVWLRFKGGKGVATSLGILLALYWPAALLCALVWIGTAAFTRISSLSALVASIFAPIFMIAFGKPLFAALTLILTIIVLIVHRENIARLMKGTEPRIGARKA